MAFLGFFVKDRWPALNAFDYCYRLGSLPCGVVQQRLAFGVTRFAATVQPILFRPRRKRRVSGGQ